jgi:hypothetical protein
MKQHSLEPDDAPLRALLRESRPSPPLPPRFAENVWRRIEQSEPVPALPPGFRARPWFERLLQPRWALGSLAALLVASATAGVMSGTATARHAAQERYLASVAPQSFR